MCYQHAEKPNHNENETFIMAKKSISRTPEVVEPIAGKTARASTAQTPAPEAHPFLSLNAKYTIDPNSKSDGLLDDATGLLGIANHSLLQLCQGEFDDERLHGIRYMIEMAQNAMMAAHVTLAGEGKFSQVRAAKGGVA